MYIQHTRKLAFSYWRFPSAQQRPMHSPLQARGAGCRRLRLENRYTYLYTYIYTRASLRGTPQQQVDCLLT